MQVCEGFWDPLSAPSRALLEIPPPCLSEGLTELSVPWVGLEDVRAVPAPPVGRHRAVTDGGWLKWQSKSDREGKSLLA